MPRPLPLITLALAFNLPLGLLTYGYGFTASYVLNDQVQIADHLSFIGAGAVALALSAVLMSAVMRSGPGGLSLELVTAALLASAAVHLVFLGVFFAFAQSDANVPATPVLWAAAVVCGLLIRRLPRPA